MKKLAIITSHPIQYNAPWFKLLTDRNKISIKVFYTWNNTLKGPKYDPGFGRNIEWDIPLLNGYDYTFVENTAKDPGSHHFLGLVNPGLNRQVQEWKPDAVLVFGWAFKSHLNALRYFHSKVPVFFRGDSTLLDETGGIKKFIKNAILTWVYSNVDYAFFVGANNKAYYKQFGKKEKSLWFVPHAIDNDRFADLDGGFHKQAAAWRDQLGIAKDDFVFLFAGKFEPKKNPRLLIEAFLQSALPGAHLVLVGNGEQETMLKELAVNRTTVHFMDFKNQSVMPAVYYMCNVFVLPSQGPEETWGLAINEAMACNKPVLASNKCGGSIDLIKNGINGYMFKSGEKLELKDKMKILFDQKHQLEQMGRHSREIIQEYSFTNICERIELLLHKI